MVEVVAIQTTFIFLFIYGNVWLPTMLLAPDYHSICMFHHCSTILVGDADNAF